MVNLYSGRSLDDEQIAAIVHLVSSSVPHLVPENVTVVDQRGNLLSSGESDGTMAPSSSQFSYNRKLELTYSDRIRKLLEPIVGAGRVRATVNADLDFTVTERTQERYNPDLPSLRSEQVSEDQSANAGGPSGVPGALSNQPPEAGVLREAASSGTGSEDASLPVNSSKRTIRNYELDKTISHTKLSTGNIRRLSIAVVIDDKQEFNDNDEVVSKPWTDEELSRFTALVKEAVGFNVQRGDSVNVINSSFIPAPTPEAIPEPTLMEQPWIWDVARQAVGVLGFLLVIFAVLKPVMRSLAEKGSHAGPVTALATAGGNAAAAVGEDQLSLSGANAQQPQLNAPSRGYEQQLETAKAVVAEDPKRVAQVVKNWVAEDG
jgi:flagellar M-ring protein FliF